MNFYEDVLKNKELIINTLMDLLKIPSVLDKFDPSNKEYPFGKNIKEALLFMKNKADNDGFNTLNVDNYALEISYGTNEDIAILAHLDVVPATGKWDSDPFNPIIKDNKIFARGAIDDKGPLIASYFALKLLKDKGFKFNKKIKLILGCDEESGFRCIDYYNKKIGLPDYGFSPDAEFPFIYGEKGNASFDIIYNKKIENIKEIRCGDRYNIVPDLAYVIFNNNILEKEFKKYLLDNNLKGEVEGNKYIIYGLSAHAMNPKLGVNAGYYLIDFLNKYINNEMFNLIVNNFDTDGKKFKINSYNEKLLDLTMNFAVFNYINDSFKLGINFRYPNINDPLNIKNKFLELTKHDNNFKLIELEKKEPHLVDLEDDFFKILHDAYIKYTNDTSNKPYTIGGGTYARVLKKGVAYGMVFPGREDVFHKPNEYVHIEDLLKACAIYMEAIYNLCVLEK